LSAGFIDRDVHMAVPAGDAPSTGWPTVVYFQGSLASAELAFTGRTDDLAGQFELAETVQALLDAGFAVVAPEVLGEGSTYWQTNIAPASTFWSGTYDDSLMLELLAQFDDDDGDFGHVDTNKLFAMGISSGGFMTSRMAVSYAGRFKALAIHSGGYAWCSTACVLPGMPEDHPPTLFVHGADDVIVLPAIMQMYADALDDDGVEVDVQLVEGGAHAWLAPAVTSVPAWFLAH
jgi:dienelactone hydrolase